MAGRFGVVRASFALSGPRAVATIPPRAACPPRCHVGAKQPLQCPAGATTNDRRGAVPALRGRLPRAWTAAFAISGGPPQIGPLLAGHSIEPSDLDRVGLSALRDGALFTVLVRSARHRDALGGDAVRACYPLGPRREPPVDRACSAAHRALALRSRGHLPHVVPVGRAAQELPVDPPRDRAGRGGDRGRELR